MFGIGLQEIVIIAIIILLLFGGKKIPELMNGIGQGIKNFKDGMNGIEHGGSKGTDSPDKEDGKQS